MCSGKKSQETKSSVPVKIEVHSYKSKIKLQVDDRNSQENINRRPMQSQTNHDKKSQANRNCQKSVM